MIWKQHLHFTDVKTDQEKKNNEWNVQNKHVLNPPNKSFMFFQGFKILAEVKEAIWKICKPKSLNERVK